MLVGVVSLIYFLNFSTIISKAVSAFEDDERFIAVERAKDREDLFEDYILELEKKVTSFILLVFYGRKLNFYLFVGFHIAVLIGT